MRESRPEIAWAEAETIAFGDRLVASEAFLALFREGMSLIEETAAYLDGPGRQDSRELGRAIALAYATESMRLTTRLMQLASWLLLQRAVNEGELTKEQARLDKGKMKIGGLAGEGVRAVTDLPEALQVLIERSLRLQERVVHLDRLIYGTEDEKRTVNPLERDMARLKAAFGGEG
jgi:regulator of CtrA degradation